MLPEFSKVETVSHDYNSMLPLHCEPLHVQKQHVMVMAWIRKKITASRYYYYY